MINRNKGLKYSINYIYNIILSFFIYHKKYLNFKDLPYVKST